MFPHASLDVVVAVRCVGLVCPDLRQGAAGSSAHHELAIAAAQSKVREPRALDAPRGPSQHRQVFRAECTQEAGLLGEQKA